MRGLSTIARITVFNVVSIATTTGYATTDYNLWPTITFSLMLLLSCFTTCSGSTGGGVKLIRAIIMLKQARRNFKNGSSSRNYSYQNWKSNCCK